MANEIKAFNSDEHGFIDLQVVLLGRPIATLQKLTFKVMQEKGNVYGAGAKPIARTRGQISYEGSITMLLSEYIALLQSQGNPAKGPLGILPFDVIACFAPAVGAVITTFRIVYAEFTSAEVSASQGDLSIPIELPIVFGDIEHNV
jgi:hypothetical protein